MIGLAITIVVVGFLIWLVEAGHIPVAAPFGLILRIVALVFVVVVVLSAFGLLPLELPMPRVVK